METKKMARKTVFWALLALALVCSLTLAGCMVTTTDGTGKDRDKAIYLFQDSFEKVSLEKDSEQWFSFTVSSAGTYYIHVIFGTLESLNVRVFNRNGSPVGGEAPLWERKTDWSFSRELPETGRYYIRVRPYYSGDSGTYQIAYNTSAAAPQ
jgi:predicted small secreted protein